MTEHKATEKFDAQIATLMYRVGFLLQAVSLLKRSLEGNPPLTRKVGKDERTLRVILNDYIITSLVALFDEKDRKVISLTTIHTRFKKQFPDKVFQGYIYELKEFRKKHGPDLARFEKNRNLMTAHFGGGKEQLGYEDHVAKNIGELLGTKSPVAKKDSLKFINPVGLVEMEIIKDFKKLKQILENLHLEKLSS